MAIIAEYKFNNTLYDLIPEFNAEFTNYTYEDVVDGNITTRTIYSDSLPTLIRFGKVGSDSDKSNSLLEVNYINTSNINDMTYMFSYCKSLTSINTNNWDTSRLINIQSMFYYCEKLTSLDLSSWDTSNIKYMDRVFYCCLSLKSLDLSKWDTSNVVDIARMFSYCSQMTKLNLSGWDVDKVVDTSMAFAYCNKLHAIRIFDCKPNMITTLNYSSLFPTEIISGKTRVIYCDEDTAGILQPPTNWVFSFEDDSIIAKYVFNINIDTLPTFNDGYVYAVNDVYNGDGTTTRTITSDSSPSSMSFREKSGLISVSKLNTSGLTDMSYMFYQCTNLTSVDVSKWNTGNVTNMSYMFNKCTNLTSVDLSNFDTSNVINMYSMFYGCSSLTSLDLSNFNTSNVNDMCNMFRDCTRLTSLDVSNWNTGNVKNMSYMFYQCYELTTIEGLSNWNTGNVKNMSCMFFRCYDMTSLDLSNFDTSKVTDMHDMFCQCSSLTKLDLSGWDTSQVTSFSQMFYYCIKLTMIKGLSDWDTSQVTNMNYMFYEDRLLKTMDLSGWNTSKVNTMNYMFYYCNKLEYLNLSGWDLSAVTTYNNIFPSTSGVLNHISLYHCPVGTINFIIENVKAYNVPDKIIEVGNADISMLKVKVANNKGWYILNYLISKFVFDNTIDDTMPVCNDEFEFDCQDNVNGEYTTRIINGYNMPYHISFRDSAGLIEIQYLNTKGLDSLNSIFRNCKSLRKVNISKFDIEDVIDFNSMFYLCKDLSEIVAEGVKPEVINKIIEFLPNKKSPFGGIIKVNSGFDLDSINVEIANNKSWEITDNIFVRYLFDKSIEENVDPYLDNRCTTKLVLLNDINNICTKVLINDIHAEEMISPTLMRFSNKIGLIEVKEIQVDTLFSLADMFYKCTNLVEIKFSTGGYTFGNLDNMFYGCESLVKADFSKFAVHHNINQTRCMFEGCTSLREVPGVNNLGSYDAAFMFKDCTSLTSINLEYTYFYGDMEGFFEGCINLKEIKHLDDYSYMNDIFNASKMFKNCKSLTEIPIGGGLYVSDPFIFDMFDGCDSLERIIIVDANSTDTEAMNKYIEALPTVEAGSHHVIVTNGFTINEEVAAAKNWEVRCYYLYNIVITESGNTPSVSFTTTDGAEINQLVKYKKLSDNTYESACYADLLPTRYQFTVINSKLLSLSYINTSNVTSMYNMFYDCRGLVSADLSNCDTSKVTDMRNVFQNCITLTELDLSNWNTSRVTNMEFMFHQCRAVTSINVSGWSTSKVTSMNSMFKECENLISIEGISSFNPKLVTNMTMMFYQCNKLLKLDLSGWDTSKVTSMGSMFYNCKSLTSLDVSNFNTGEVTNMNNMFSGCTNLTSLDVSNFNTGEVTNMNNMFYDCRSLTSLDVSNFNTSKVTDMEKMFHWCSKLTSIKGLSEFNTGNVTTIANMLSYCRQLTTLDLSKWNTDNMTNIRYLAAADSSLTSINLSGMCGSKVTSIDHMFEFCTELTEVNLSEWNTASVRYTVDMFKYASKLTTIIMKDSDKDSINDMLWTLPVRTADSPGRLLIDSDIDVSTLEDIDIVNERYWNVEAYVDLGYKIAEYTFNSDTDTLPTFNSGFVPAVERTESRTIYVTITESTFDIPITSLDDIVSIEIPRYEGNGNYQKTVESNSDYIRVEYIDVTSGPYIRIDSTGKCTVGCSEPWDVNENIVIKYKVDGYTYTDVDNGDGTVTRTIFSKTLPTSISFRDKTGLVSLSYLDTSNVTTMDNMFYDCINLTSLDLSSFNTSKVTSMSEMFCNCSILSSLDISSFNTSNVTDMYQMFCNCDNLTSLDLSNFNTSKVENMGYMFYRCTNLTSIDLSSFNTSKVTNMYAMFYECSSLTSLDLSNFNTSDVTDMGYMFYKCSSLTSLDLSSFNTTNVTSMTYMFIYCGSLTSLYLSGWDTSKVTNISNVFRDCTKLASVNMKNSDISSINKIIAQLPTLSSPNYGILRIGKTDMTAVDTTTANDKLWFVNGIKIAEYEFSTDFDPTFNEGFEYTAITNNNSKIIMSNGVRPSDISFENKTGLVSLSYLDTSELKLMDNLFSNCSKLSSVDLNNVDTSKITHMYSLFSNCNSLITIDVSNFDTSNVIDMSGVFANCKQLERIEGLNNWDTSKATTINYMFQCCNKLLSLDLSNWDTSKATSLINMFFECAALTTIEGLNNWNTSNIYSMNYAFYYCTNLTSLDLSGWDTSKVTNMRNMFNYCTNLTSLDLSSFDTSKVTNMRRMFSSCSELKSLDIRNFDVNKVTDIENIFTNSNNIKIIRLDNSDVNTINTLISLLPERNSIGKIYVTGIEDVSGIDKATAASKKWKIVIKENRMNSFIPINLGGKSIRAIYTNNETYL